MTTDDVPHLRKREPRLAHVEPCDDAEEGVGGHGSFALTMESAITKMTNPDRLGLRMHEVMTKDHRCAAVARARTEPHGHMLS